MPLCTTPPRIAAAPNPSCFQIVETGAGDCSISMRSFYDSHLHIRWARCSLRTPWGEAGLHQHTTRSPHLKFDLLLTEKIGFALRSGSAPGDPRPTNSLKETTHEWTWRAEQIARRPGHRARAAAASGRGHQ